MTDKQLEERDILIKENKELKGNKLLYKTIHIPFLPADHHDHIIKETYHSVDDLSKKLEIMQSNLEAASTRAKYFEEKSQLNSDLIDMSEKKLEKIERMSFLERLGFAFKGKL